jgi:hypothetical protein
VRGRERSWRRLPVIGTWLARGVLARLGTKLGVLSAGELPGRELAGSVLLVLARRLGTMRRWSLRELAGAMLPGTVLPGALLSVHRHSGDAPVSRGRSIRVTAGRELLLCLGAMGARLSLLLTGGPRRGILPRARRLPRALPAWLRPGGRRPERR